MAHVITETDKSQFCKESWQAAGPFQGWRQERSEVLVWRQPGGIPSYLQESQPFHPLLAFCWLNEACPHLGGQSALPSIDLNVNLTQNTLRETPRKMLHQISGHPMAQPSWHKNPQPQRRSRVGEEMRSCALDIWSWGYLWKLKGKMCLSNWM